MTADSVPRILGPCELGSILGGGGFGVVYRARLVEDRHYASAGSTVAIKLLKPEMVDSGQVVHRFHQEAQYGRTVEHPAVVKTYEVGESSGNGQTYHFLVMEYVEGRTLADLICLLEIVPETLLRHLAIQVSSALAAIHLARLIHRDIKPGNILVTYDHELKVTDFGLAMAVDAAQLRGLFEGTVSYAAPEQHQGRGITPSSDLYSLGIVLYEASTGTHPFASSDMATVIAGHLDVVPSKVGNLNPQVTPFFEEIVTQLIEKAPENRFGSAAELQQVLEDGEGAFWWRRRERALRTAGAQPRLRRVRVRNLMTFLGRDRELAQLHAALEEAGRGRGRVLVVEGEPGAGKSRLLDEFMREIEAGRREVHILYGSEAPGAEGKAHALAQGVLNHFGPTELDSKLAPYLPRAKRLVPGFAAMLSGSPQPLGEEPLPRESVAPLFEQLVAGLSEEQPVVVIAEDLHHASAEAVELFLTLAASCPGKRILLVTAVRTGALHEDISRVSESVAFEKISLKRLADHDIEGLVVSELGDDFAARQVARRIASRADGNPFFVAELLRELRMRHLAEESASQTLGAAAEADLLEGTVVPVSIRELLLEHLEDLPEPERALLELGAVQGYQFDPELLALVQGCGLLEVLENLAELERRRLIHAQGVKCHFNHHLLQEAIYESLPPEERRDYHFRLAQAYERRAGLAEAGAAPSGADAVVLTEHYLKGGRAAEAAKWVLAGLDHLAGRYESGKLLDLARLMLEATADPALRCDLQLRQADCLQLLGRRQEEQLAARGALTDARRVDDAARVARARLAEGRTLIDEGAQAFPVLEEALERARLASAPQVAAEATGYLGHAHLRAGDSEKARRLYEKQARICLELSDRNGHAEANYYAGEACLGLGLYEEARESLEQSVDVFKELGLRRGEARALTDLSYAHWSLGAFEPSRRGYQRSLQLCREIGFVEGEAYACANLSLLCLTEGDIEGAREMTRAHRDLSRSLGSRFHLAYSSLYSGELERAVGRPERAEALFREALAESRDLGLHFAVVEAALALGRLLYEEGRAEEARPLVAEAQRLVEEHSVRIVEPLPALFLALLGDMDPAAISIPATAAVTVRAEGHLLLHWAGLGGEHLDHATALLEGLCQHLAPEQREGFWRHNPLARAARAAR